MVRIAVIGAGWAGCTAALELALRGRRVTIYEAGQVAGGRARRVVRAGLPIDNGQHLLLGAYASTLAAIERARASSPAPLPLERYRLAIRPLGERTSGLALRARGSGPIGLAAGLLTAEGLSLRDRVGVLAWFTRLATSGFRCPAEATVSDLAASCPEAAARHLLEPLCLAALNTPPSRASARVFANVLRAAFAGPPHASDFLVASTDLSSIYPEAALRAVADAGGRILLGARARLAACDADQVTVACGGGPRPYDAAVIAVGPHQVEGALPDDPAFDDVRRAAGGLAWEPIATAWLGYAQRCPVPGPVLRLDDEPGQWMFDRGDVLARATPCPDRPELAGLVSVVVSAGGPHDALDAPALARACDAQLRRLVPRWPPLAWSQGIVERRATYACTPGRPRPGSNHPHPRVALAGDWLDEQLPATLEAAVRSGLAAAAALEGTAPARTQRTVATG